MSLKVYLDDDRSAPEGWIRAYWPDEVIRLLETGTVTHLDLDYYLNDNKRGTGGTVLLAIEKMINEGKLVALPEIKSHTSSARMREQMDLAIRGLQMVWAELNCDGCAAKATQPDCGPVAN